MTPAEIPSNEYEFHFPSTVQLSKLEDYIRKYKSVCSIGCITDQQWKWEGDNFSGSFSFKTTYGLKGRCLFEGKNFKISKMVIARKNSDKLEDGYAVFGCKYGRNALLEDIYDEAINLPESEEGEFLTYDRYSNSSLGISQRENGEILVTCIAMSIEQLEKVLKTFKAKYTDPTVYLWIDKNCSEGKIVELLELIRHHNFQTYRVYDRKDTYCPIVRKINFEKEIISKRP